jgi:hypothetical protein
VMDDQVSQFRRADCADRAAAHEMERKQSGRSSTSRTGGSWAIRRARIERLSHRAPGRSSSRRFRGACQRAEREGFRPAVGRRSG